MDRHTHIHYQRNSCWAMICDHPHCWRTSGTLSLSVSLVYWTSHFYAKHQIFLRPYSLSKMYYPFRPLSHPNCYQSLSGLLPPHVWSKHFVPSVFLELQTKFFSWHMANVSTIVLFRMKMAVLDVLILSKWNTNSFPINAPSYIT